MWWIKGYMGRKSPEIAGNRREYVYIPVSIFRRVGAISSSSSYAYAWGAVAIASFIASAMYLTLPPPPPTHYLLLSRSESSSFTASALT